MTRRRTSRRGFTLLELIIAMAIAATIALVLYSAMSTAFKARAAALNQTAMMREAAIALDLIEADIENATPPAPEPTPPAGRVFGPMFGEADSLDFYTLGRDYRAAATVNAQQQSDVFADGVRRVIFTVAADASVGGKNVVNRGVQRNVLPSGTEQFEDESLVGQVAAIGFRYYDGSTWTDSWHSDDEGSLLPLAIEVTLDLAAPDGRGGEKTYHMVRVVPLGCADATALSTRGAN